MRQSGTQVQLSRFFGQIGVMVLRTTRVWMGLTVSEASGWMKALTRKACGFQLGNAAVLR
eukprot:2037250-Pleurochrysis_carterae.AAC.1